MGAAGQGEGQDYMDVVAVGDEGAKMMEEGKLNPSTMITHVGGLDAVIETTLNLPDIPGGKKLVYTGISMPLVALDDLAALGEGNPVYAALAEIECADFIDAAWELSDQLLKNGVDA